LELAHSEDTHQRSPAFVDLPEGTETAKQPTYNPDSITEMQHAASVLLLPEHQRGPLPTLLRHMSTALAKKEKEEDEMQRKLTLLQPAVSNYNPADIEQLSKAAVDAATPGEVSDPSLMYRGRAFSPCTPLR